MADYEKMYFDLVRKLEVVLTILNRAVNEGKDTFMDAYLASDPKKK